MAYLWHFRGIFIVGTYIVIVLLPTHAVMLGLHVEYTISAVGHTYEMWQEYLFGGIYQFIYYEVLKG